MSDTSNGNYYVTVIRDDIDMSHGFKGFTCIKPHFYIRLPFVKKKHKLKVYNKVIYDMTFQIFRFSFFQYHTQYQTSPEIIPNLLRLTYVRVTNYV